MLNGKFIGIKEKVNTFTVKKKFIVENKERVTMNITALGLYYAEINGKRVGDSFLTPGWTSYNKVLQVQNYDITSLINIGENEIKITINEGWYCGPVSWLRKRNFYGENPAACADIIFDNNMISTDETWTACESYIRESGIYDGEIVDLTMNLKQLTVKEIEFDKSILVMQQCENVKNIERLPVKKLITSSNGEKIYDFGQNISGVVEIKTPENFEGTLILQFSEILIKGNFYTDNLRTAKARDILTAKGETTFCPEFTFHGFRYLKVTGGEIPTQNITAIVRHTDMKKTGYLETSNRRFNRLISNVVWGQRDNFVDIPTDCPQRDERLGWTGDINAFCNTAAFNYDIRLFMKKWLNDLRNDQKKTGEISHVAPDVLGDKYTNAMWCDAITMIPWNLYYVYGDIHFLSENYAAMKKFISAREKTMEDGIICKGHEFGDWLALDQEKTICDSLIGRTDVYFITNVFHYVSLKIVYETAKILKKSADEQKYKEKCLEHLKRIQKEYFTSNGRLCFDTMTAQALALHFEVVPEEFRKKLALKLNQNVIAHNYSLSTGFIGTTYLLFALANNGYIQTAQRVMMNNGYPSWLYEVDMGATTIWERWNSLMPDGTPNPDGMNSYNHYAYGSVMDFVVKKIAGIEPIEAGYKIVRISPNPCKKLPSVKAEYQSVHGKIRSEYQYKKGYVYFFVTIPDGVKAEIVLPKGKHFEVCGGTHKYKCKWENLDLPAFTPESMVNEVFENPKARQAFNSVFNDIFHENGELDWMRKFATLQFMAEFRDGEGKLKLSEFPEMLEKANTLFENLTLNE